MYTVIDITGGKILNQVIGKWLPNLGLQLPELNMFERRNNLTGVTIINTVLPWPPLTVVGKDNDGRLYHSGDMDMDMVVNFIPN